MGFLGYLNPERAGTVGRLVEGAEYFGAAVGYGYLQNRFRERVAVGPVPLDLASGVSFKVLSLLPSFWKKSPGLVKSAAPYTNLLGNAGLMAFGHTVGAGMGAAASGVTRLVLANKSDLAAVKKVLPSATILGEIPKAPHGDFLSARELSRV